MPDWFGDSPVEMRELSPSHYDGWKRWCEKENCSGESIVMVDGYCLCLDHAEELFELTCYQERLNVGLD